MTIIETPIAGLSSAEVATRVKAGQVNVVEKTAGRSVPEIIRANVFTRINMIYAVLFAIVMSTGYFLDGMFGLLIIVNSSIGIIQEIRAKRTLDRLAIVSAAHPKVRRDGAIQEILAEEIVQDDIVELSAGDQIVVDGVVTQSDAMEVDESMLTGESDPVVKHRDDQVKSGSYVVSGNGYFQATHVGSQAYAAKLAAEASKFSLVSSELRSGIDKILKVITWILFPVGALIIFNQLVGAHQNLPRALRGMVAALVPMVPEGLVLMTSVAMMVGIIRLGKFNALVNEMPAIEGLARVDVVCADKTGTLTENKMKVHHVSFIHDEQKTVEALEAFAASETHPNPSLLAIAEAYPENPNWQVSAKAPFTSAKKYSGMSFGVNGNWILGATDVLLGSEHPLAQKAEEIGSQGMRVLLFGQSDTVVDRDNAPGIVDPAALIVLEQMVREDAAETLEYFKKQNVEVKVISGDNAVSVAAVAAKLGLGAGKAPVDARKLPEYGPEFVNIVENGTIFGRVTPEQKRMMVKALQSKGHTVAMTGDGVNDVLALKDADIGVAMGSGSPATRAVGQIVLLDNKFATMPKVVAEGRRVIGNIERVSNLFLTKTIYSIMLALMIGIAHIPFPLVPRHITIVAWFTIGIPAFVLSLAPNNEKARSGFVQRVLRFAIPTGIIIAVTSFLSYKNAYPGLDASKELVEQASTVTLVTLIMGAMWALMVIARPYLPWKIVLIAVMYAAVLSLFSMEFTQKIFLIRVVDTTPLKFSLLLGVVSMVLIEIVYWGFKRNTQSTQSTQ